MARFAFWYSFAGGFSRIVSRSGRHSMDMPHAESELARRRQRSDAAVAPHAPPTPAGVLAESVRKHGAQSALDPATVLAQSIERAPANKREVFWTIWLAHRDDLARHSLRFSSGNHADAEDALSEAMLKAAQAFQTSAVREPRAWLLRLVFNACIDRHRRHRRRDCAMQNAALNIGACHPTDHSAGSPEALLDSAQQLDELTQALRALPPLLAAPLMLYLDDISDGDIAARLNVTREVVRKRRQMARDWLRRRIA